MFHSQTSGGVASLMLALVDSNKAVSVEQAAWLVVIAR